jgi:hypothetical protein
VQVSRRKLLVPVVRAGIETVASPVMALIHFLDGEQRGQIAAVDNAAVSGEGRYRFKKQEITQSGGKLYYLKGVPETQWADPRVPEWTAALDDGDPGDD